MTSDEFGLSSGDEGDFAAATADIVSAKHGLGTDHTVRPAKRFKAEVTLPGQPLRSTSLANKILKERFGLAGFRLEQEAAITRLLEGGSAVVVLPTGGGKSLCYQVRESSYPGFFVSLC